MARRALYCLLFLGLLIALALLESRGWTLPGLPWALAGVTGLGFFWSLQGEQRPVPQAPTRSDSVSGEVALEDESGEDPVGQAKLLAEHVQESTPGQERFTVPPARNEALLERLSDLLDRVDLVKRHSGEVAIRLEQVMAQAEMLGERQLAVRGQVDSLGERMTALESRTAGYGEQLQRLSAQMDQIGQQARALAEQGARMNENIEALLRRTTQGNSPVQTAEEDDFYAEEPVQPVRRMLARQMRLRTAPKPALSQPAPAVAPAPAPAATAAPPTAAPPAPPAAAPRTPGAPAPFKVQVTTYQKGEAPRQRDINVRLGGRFF